MSSGKIMLHKIFDSQKNLKENMLNFVTSTVSADVLAPLGARPSADTVMIKFRVLYILRTSTWRINSSSPGQNVRHFADNIFKCIFMNEKSCILDWISLKFIPKGPTDKKSTLVQVMTWHWIGNKPLPEQMLSSSLMHLCGTRAW